MTATRNRIYPAPNKSFPDAKIGGDTNYLSVDETGQIRSIGDATQWEDLRFPFTGRRLDLSAGNLEYDFLNGGVKFKTSSRLNATHAVSMLAQLPHRWEQGTDVDAHFHWYQISEDLPNWLLLYKKIKNGEIITMESDLTNHTPVKCTGHRTTFLGMGTIVQISAFGFIDCSDMAISDMIHLLLVRDVNNESGLFDGTDPSSTPETTLEFDLHYRVNSLGSNDIWVKY